MKDLKIVLWTVSQMKDLCIRMWIFILFIQIILFISNTTMAVWMLPFSVIILKYIDPHQVITRINYPTNMRITIFYIDKFFKSLTISTLREFQTYYIQMNFNSLWMFI